MILKNQFLIIAYIVIVLICIFIAIKRKKWDKYTTIVSIFFIVTLLLSLYYYRPLSMEDVLDYDKYRTLMESSTEIEAEEVKNSSLVDTNVIEKLEKITIRNTSKDYGKLKSQFVNNTNSYVVKRGNKNIFRFSILGNYEYLEFQGVYYKHVE